MLGNFVAKLSESEKKVFYITLIFVLLALMDRLFLGPSLDKLQMIDEEIAAQKVGIKRDLRFLTYKDKINKESNEFKPYFVKQVNDKDVVNADFLRVVERLARSAKVNLIKSHPTETKKEDKYTEYYANLDCTGELDDVMNFMHMINSTEELLKIVEFNMSPKRGTPNGVSASMKIVKLIMSPNLSSK